jgi:nucleotide-binding universal stress UspA family protein
MWADIEEGFERSCCAAPDRIVVATALTDLEYLAPFAIAHAEAAKAELVFLHAIGSGTDHTNATYYNPLKADRDARLTLEVLARHVRLRNIECSVAVRHGEPAEVLDDYLREKPFGRLMIGARATAEGPEGTAKFGRTAGELLQQTPVPVCVFPARIADASKNKSSAKSETDLPETRFGMPKVIVYVTGEDGAHGEGVRFALDVAQYFRSEVVLLQISKRVSAGMEADSLSCVKGLWPRMRQIRRTDASVSGLLETAEACGAEMILVETPFSLPEVSAEAARLPELIAQSSCPVLAFPVLPRDCDHRAFPILGTLKPDSLTIEAR